KGRVCPARLAVRPPRRQERQISPPKSIALRWHPTQSRERNSSQHQSLARLRAYRKFLMRFQVPSLATALKTSDKPAAERAIDVAKNYALGSVLDANVGRLTSAAIFGVPAAVEGAQQAAQGKRDP